MDIDALITEKIQRLQDLNGQMQTLGKKIGALQEEGQALHNAALEIRGAINGLAELKAKDEADKKAAEEKAKGLILRDKSLVAPDGKTVVVDANAAPQAPAAVPVAETPAPTVVPTEPAPAEPAKTPITLEVQ